MQGNVWEICRDGWDPKCYKSRKSSVVSDPLQIPNVPTHAMRGGSFVYHAFYCRSGARDEVAADRAISDVGFRVLREIPAP